MKYLMRTKKAFTKKAIKRIFNYDVFYHGNSKFIAIIHVPFESDFVKKNIEAVNKLLNDPIFNLIENDFNKIYEYPILNYIDYYNTTINYKIKTIDGKPVREAVINDELKEVVNEYAITVGPMDYDTGKNNIVLTEPYLDEEAELWDFESIHSLIPNIVDTLIKEGYAIVEETKGDESNE